MEVSLDQVGGVVLSAVQAAAEALEELPECIRRLHDDPGLRGRLAENAGRRADDFRIEACADKVLAGIL